MAFSSTVRSPNGLESWKVRAIFRCEISQGCSPARLSPLKRTSPVSGGKYPAIMLNAVVFPAPLGPMSPRISPGSSVKLKPLTAWLPPKDLLMFLTSRSGIAGPLSAVSRRCWPGGVRRSARPSHQPPERLNQPLGEEEHRQDEDHPVDHEVQS